MKHLFTITSIVSCVILSIYSCSNNKKVNNSEINEEQKLVSRYLDSALYSVRKIEESNKEILNISDKDIVINMIDYIIFHLEKIIKYVEKSYGTIPDPELLPIREEVIQLRNKNIILKRKLTYEYN